MIVPKKPKDFYPSAEEQIETSETFPERCPLIPDNEILGTRYRHLLYGNYRTVFRIAGKTVYVLRVIHGARLLDTSMFEG
jgi:plasmid stabilization system protein ParE